MVGGGGHLWGKSAAAVRHEARGPERTICGSIVAFRDTSLARGWSFYGRGGGGGRSLGRGFVGARCGLWLGGGLLFLFAAAEKATEASFDLG